MGPLLPAQPGSELVCKAASQGAALFSPLNRVAPQTQELRGR